MSGTPPGLALRDPGVAALLLAALTGLFLLRVLGQFLVATRASARLPPMAEWYSGLVPYPRLLAIQLAMLVSMAAVVVALAVRVPTIASGHAGLGGALVAIAYPYAAAMLIRYAVRMWRHPEARWLGRTIPIWFHLVLAAWLFVLGSYLRAAAG